MSQTTRSVCELLPYETCNLYAPHPDPVGSRTLLKQYFLDPVLPMLTLLSMSALTVVLLVTIVMAVADMDVQLPDGYVNIDPWAGAHLGPASGFFQDQDAYADLTLAADPGEDRVSWPAFQADDPF